jgi:phosphomannomutase
LSHDDLIEAARAWLGMDPDPETRAELSALVETGDRAAIAERFDGRLEFGTAGIRGELGAGPARMNRVVVRQVSAGLADRLATEGEASGRIVVVGRDARHKSEELAHDAAAVIGKAGFDVRAFAGHVPTPLVAFATRHLDAAAGVQITASHNPPRDNGYKVYWRGGAQIVAPLDEEIAEAIEAAEPVGDLAGAPSPTTIGGEVSDAYRRQALSLLHGGGNRGLTIVYTPLHGVAGEIVTGLLAEAGFADVHAVPEQSRPDPDFPTVDFPNPEIEGALDLAEELAAEVDADLVLANDPDGDRIAVAVPDAEGIRILTGDEVGCLLADSLLREGLGPDRPPTGSRMVATTAVSSQLLARIAEDHGVEFAETLTGFKWLAKAVEDAVSRGVRPVVCYEQALGVMLGDVVRDKDGITAALVVADLAARLSAQGRTLDDALDDLARRHGLHLTDGRSVRLTGADEGLAGRIVTRVRTDPPKRVDGIEVVRVDDYVELARRHADGVTEPIDLPAYPLVSLVLADGSRLQARPSGTEPLLKFYIEVVEPVNSGADDVAAARNRGRVRVTRLADAFVAVAG